jgi:hypothetical protein
MDSSTKNRVIAGGVGLLFAVIYGFWTAILTGGGHVNFIWIGLFIFVEFFGLYFPLMAVLAVNLRSFVTKIVFASLIAFNLLASSIMILGWVSEPPDDRPSDFERTVRANGIGDVIFFAAIHFLPTMIFLFILIKSILSGPSPDEDDSISLDLS